MKIIHTSDGRTLYKSDDGRWLKKGEAEKLVAKGSDVREPDKEAQIKKAEQIAQKLNETASDKADLAVPAVRKMTLESVNYEKKKWDKRKSPYADRNRELENLDSGLAFMEENFGDVRDLIGGIYIRNTGWPGLYDRDGMYGGKGRATFFQGGGGAYIGESLIIHEFAHAITDEIAEHYKELGYGSRQEVFAAMRSEVLKELGKEEKKYDKRKWADRPHEFLSMNIEMFGDSREGKREDEYYQSKGRRFIYRETPPAEAAMTLNVVKKWWKKIGR